MKFNLPQISDPLNVVTLAEMEQALAFSSGWNSETLTINIGSAVSFVEGATNRAVYTRTVTGYGTKWPSTNEFRLPFGNIQSVTSVKYLKTTASNNTDYTTLASGTDYFTRINGDECIIYPPSTGWPTDLTDDYKNAIEVVYVAGPSTAPGWAKSAVIAHAADLQLRQDVGRQHVMQTCHLNFLPFDFSVND